MEFKQIWNLFGEDSHIKWTIVYNVCRVQKAFDWMEIRAALKALSKKVIKNIYIGTKKYIIFLRSNLKKNLFIFGVVVTICTRPLLSRCLQKNI